MPYQTERRTWWMLVLAGLISASCASNEEPKASGCLTVSQHLRDALNVDAAAAVRSDEGDRWYVSTPAGATWITNINPEGPEQSGLTLPLNDAARAASELGTDARPGAPAYRGASDSDPRAVESRQCAEAVGG